MNNPPDTDNGKDLLKRWSRLKQQEQQDVADVPSQPPVNPDTEEPPLEPQALTDADMPDLGSMGEGSDYSVFLSPKVSDQLRARALRQLFRFPGLGVRDGLDDYDDDYTQIPELGNAVTHEMRRMLASEIGREDNNTDPHTLDSLEQETRATAQKTETNMTPEDENTPKKDA